MFELRLLAPEARVEAVTEALEALGASSVSVEDADAQSDAEQALFGEPGQPAAHGGWRRSLIAALFAGEHQAREAGDVLAVQDFFDAGCELLGLAELPEQDWVRLTQSQFAPVEITPDFWIVPSWHAPPSQARRVIRLDPGLAFGTGTHPTTRMCLRHIARRGESVGLGRRVLDYGCGSGILAIGAAMFAAAEVDAVDIDPAAVESTRRNAEANGVRLQAGLPEAAHGTTFDLAGSGICLGSGPAAHSTAFALAGSGIRLGSGPAAHSAAFALAGSGIRLGSGPAAHGRYDTVLANILASPLKVLAPLLCAQLAPGGELVLAGILERQAEELQAAYARWLRLACADRDDGWVLLAGRV